MPGICSNLFPWLDLWHRFTFLIELTGKTEGTEYLGVAVTDALGVVSLPRKFVGTQMLHHGLVLSRLFSKDMCCYGIAIDIR